MRDKEELIREYLESLYDYELIEVYNDYCEENNDYDSHIYDSSEINDVFSSYTPEEMLLQAEYGDYNSQASYFCFDGYGNIQSIFEYELDNHMYIEDIITYVIDNDSDLGVTEIREILDNEEGEEDNE